MQKVNDIRIQVNWFFNRKVMRLHKKYGSDGPLALILLWCWAGTERIDGRLTNMTPRDITEQSMFDYDANECTAEDFVDTLVDCGLLSNDGDCLILHEWEEHQPWAAGAKARSEKASKAADARWKKQPQPNATSIPGDATSITKHPTSIAEQCPSDAPFPSSPIPSLPKDNINSKIVHPNPQNILPVDHFDAWRKSNFDTIKTFADQYFLYLGGWEWAKEANILDKMRPYIDTEGADKYQHQLGKTNLWLGVFRTFCTNEARDQKKKHFKDAQQKRQEDKAPRTGSPTGFKQAGQS